MNESSQFIETFRQEAEELLLDIEEAILIIERNPQDVEAVNRLFRAMHTIKGSSGMCGMNGIADFTHHVETALDKVRDGTVPVTREFINLVLKSSDHIKAILDSGDGIDRANEEIGRKIISGLNSLVNDMEETGLSQGPEPKKDELLHIGENRERSTGSGSSLTVKSLHPAWTRCSFLMSFETWAIA